MIYKAHEYFFVLLSTVTPHSSCPSDSAVQSPEGFVPSILLFLVLLKFNIYAALFCLFA